ncbi:MULTISPECIES: hypothetical protein [Leptolyngbya]|nr:hypothetical protein [Leptolyngbya boryana]
MRWSNIFPAIHEVKLSPETLATAIRIGNLVNWHKAIAVRDSSQGSFNA